MEIMAVKQFVSALLFTLFLVPKSSAYLGEGENCFVLNLFALLLQEERY